VVLEAQLGKEEEGLVVEENFVVDFLNYFLIHFSSFLNNNLL
jgi:hypothetical protein